MAPAGVNVPCLLLLLLLSLVACSSNNGVDLGYDPGIDEDVTSAVRRCLIAQDIPVECVDSYMLGLGHYITKQLTLIILRTPNKSEQREQAYELANYLCTAFRKAVDTATKYSSNDAPDKRPDRPWTEQCFQFGDMIASGESTEPEMTVAPNTIGPSVGLAIDEQFPCGDGEGRTVLCASSNAPAGNIITLAMTMTGAVPLADPMYYHQYGFVFDSDADPNNNYRASPAYPNDFFDSTDRWYVASYSPQGGWKIEVSNASGSTITPVSSDARIVIEDQTLMLLVPASELATSCPAFRLTAFTHLGDYGLNPPHEWSGDVEPAVGEPLLTNCIDFTSF